ncbi:hypothetical protein KOW79_016507 [Hemibagrus wyckioides]|uniref:Uncharacterized protein n=1 Tax=Hemibagrus wyckioides TaxID=337641 RepID=A0A9D3NFI4_9TELE|nr:hypothetical protein KOW79_016507 [Hemibagrus wyckioides]
MDPGCECMLKRIRPTQLMPKVSEDVEEEMFDPSSSPEDNYAVPLPPTPPETPQSSQQLSPPRSEESTISGHGEGVVVSGHADEGPAGMEVQNGPSDENASCRSDDPDAPLSYWLQRIEFFKCLESAVLHLLNRTLTLYAEEKCNGCRIRHPSQRQHTCLLDPPDDVFQTCFHGLVRRLWNPLFIRAVEKYMNSYGFCDSYGSEDISTVTETLLLGYKSGGSIYDRIYRIKPVIEPEMTDVSRLIELMRHSIKNRVFSKSFPGDVDFERLENMLEKVRNSSTQTPWNIVFKAETPGAKSEVRRHKFPTGFFANLGQFKTEMDASFRKINSDIYLSYNNYLRKFDFQAGGQTHVRFYPPLAYIMGLKHGEWLKFDRKLADHPSDLRAGFYHMFCYCDAVHPQLATLTPC